MKPFFYLLLIPLAAGIGGIPNDGTLPIGPGDVLRPGRARSNPIYIGFDLGLDYAHYIGDHVYLFPNPLQPDLIYHSVFTDGDGIGIILQGVLDVPVAKNMGIIGKLGYIQRTDAFEKTFDYPLAFIDPVTGWPGTATLHGEMDLTVSFLNIDLLLRYQLAPGSWYLLGGFSFARLLANSGDLDQRIVAPDNVYYRNPADLPIREISLEDIEWSGFEDYRVAIKAGVGTWFAVSKSVFLTPELCIDYPFNAFLKKSGEPLAFIPASDVRFPSVTLTAGLRFGL
ncbi:MAG: hypothetical protein QHI48_09640 [Bacteroidota bacterium]|nr:hypothetical protein [Bacteroidota bacterium]